MNKLYILLACCCCSSSAGAGAFFGGFIPNTTQYVLKKMKKLIQIVIALDATPESCENLYKYIKETKGTSAAESASHSLSEKERHILEKVYFIGRMDVTPEKICDKSSIDSSIALFKNVQNAPEGEDVSVYCNNLKDLGNENEDKRHPTYYWDESKKKFIRDGKYFSDAFGGRSGPELEGPVIAKCEAVGINIR